MINMILAVGLNGELGDSSSPDGLPWKKNPEDLAHFQKMTKGNVVVYGGNTFRHLQEIGFEDGLPDRDNYVITRNRLEDTDRVRFGMMKCMEYLLRVGYWERECFIVGGKSIYNQLHQYCDKVYLTRINQEFPEADVKISLEFLSDFSIIGHIPLNDYSEVEVWQRNK